MSLSNQQIQKIAVVGNAAGGKTELSRRLAKLYDLPITHVDSVQFSAGMKMRPLDETRKTLQNITKQEKWLIDGFGPLDLIEERFLYADKIIFIDLPLWRHYWWATKRQIKNLWSRRQELPVECNELNYAHTIKLFKTLWRIHTKMRPELIKIFQRDNLKSKMIVIRNVKQWNQIFIKGTV